MAEATAKTYAGTDGATALAKDLAVAAAVTERNEASLEERRRQLNSLASVG